MSSTSQRVACSSVSNSFLNYLCLRDGLADAGKTSLLRAAAGLRLTGSGSIVRHGTPVGRGSAGDIFFVPQKPYVVLGTLRDQLLYPTWSDFSEPRAHAESNEPSANGVAPAQKDDGPTG